MFLDEYHCLFCNFIWIEINKNILLKKVASVLRKSQKMLRPISCREYQRMSEMWSNKWAWIVFFLITLFVELSDLNIDLIFLALIADTFAHIERERASKYCETANEGRWWESRIEFIWGWQDKTVIQIYESCTLCKLFGRWTFLIQKALNWGIPQLFFPHKWTIFCIPLANMGF